MFTMTRYSVLFLCLIFVIMSLSTNIFARRRSRKFSSSLRSRLKLAGLLPYSRRDSRSRVMTRINRLGSNKIHLLRTGQLKGMNKKLPPGYSLVGGKVMDVTNKMIQRSVQSGTAYFSFHNKMSKFPLYIRPGQEMGWHFVVFQDPFYWRGSGHLILLKKMLGVAIRDSQSENRILYEAYLLSLRMSIHPKLSSMDPYFKAKLRRRKMKLGRLGARRRFRRPIKPIRYRISRKIRNNGRKKRSARFLRNQQTCFIQRLNVTEILLEKMRRGVHNNVQQA